MTCRIVELRHKEVISAGDGARLGFVDDVKIKLIGEDTILVDCTCPPKRKRKGFFPSFK